MIVLPIFLSTPDLVNGTPVFLATVLFSTSTPIALLGENDVPGNPNIFIIILFNYKTKIWRYGEANVRYVFFLQTSVLVSI